MFLVVFFTLNWGISGKSNNLAENNLFTYSAAALSQIAVCVAHPCSFHWVFAIVESGHHQQSGVGDHDQNYRVPPA